MLTLLLLAATHASCLDRYDQAAWRSAEGMALSSGLGGLATIALLVGPQIIVNEVPAGKDAGAYALIALLTGVGFVSTTAAGSGGGFTTRYQSVNGAYSLLVESSMGDGPALRAYSADLSQELGHPVPVEAVAARIVELDALEVLCTPRPKGLRALDALVRAGLEAGER